MNTTEYIKEKVELAAALMDLPSHPVSFEDENLINSFRVLDSVRLVMTREKLEPSVAFVPSPYGDTMILQIVRPANQFTQILTFRTDIPTAKYAMSQRSIGSEIVIPSLREIAQTPGRSSPARSESEPVREHPQERRKELKPASNSQHKKSELDSFVDSQFETSSWGAYYD